MTVKIMTKPASILKKHITKCVKNNNYAAKTLLYSSIGLSFYSNIVDSVQLGKNKEIEKDERKYLQAFKITEGFVSSAAQAGVGLAVISDKTQKALRNKLSRANPKLAETLKNSTGRKNIMKLSSLFAAVVLTKRILVPFIVTPLASVLKNKMGVNNVAKQDGSVENIFENRKYRVEDYDD